MPQSVAPTTITRVEVLDVRFPTSAGRHGSDAMHPDPDYSAAYVILHTDRPDGLSGHGLTFTHRPRQRALRRRRSRARAHGHGVALESITADMGGFWRR